MDRITPGPLRLMPIAAAAGLLAAGLWWRSRDGTPPSEHRGIVVVTAATPRGPPTPVRLVPVTAAQAVAAAPTATAGLERRIAAEPRDPAWADASMALLTRQLADVPALSVAGGLRVVCATTLCEATGWAPAGMDAANRALYWEMVQGPALRAFTAARGLPVEAAELRPDGRMMLVFRRSAVRERESVQPEE